MWFFARPSPPSWFEVILKGTPPSPITDQLMIFAQVDKNAFVSGDLNARNQPNAF